MVAAAAVLCSGGCYSCSGASESTLEGQERREHSVEDQAAEPIKVGREEEDEWRKEGWAKAGGTGGEGEKERGEGEEKRSGGRGVLPPCESCRRHKTVRVEHEREL